MWFSAPSIVRPGDAAPAFTLPAHDGRAIALVDYRGKSRVVLTFYRDDETAGAREALHALDEALPRFKGLKAQVLAVSPNPSESQARFASKLGLGFPLLSDTAREVARHYGVMTVGPLFRRLTVVIEGRGLVRLVMRGNPTSDDLVAYLVGLHGDLPGT
jgi:peroxiredoxin Q/BCP